MNGSTNWTTTLTGTTPSWRVVRSRGVTAGRFISAADENNAASVIVLGPDTAAELFGAADPVGQSLSYNGVRLEVIGVLTNLSSSEEASNNDLAVVPLSTYAQRLVGGANRGSVSSIYVKASSEHTLSAAYQEANTLLMNAHGITTPANADFSIATQQSILQAATSVDDTLTVMLAGIAVISLLVGGIGVMNIMLVSVTERVREIGVRKAIGARPALIRRQFLVEASVLGLAGGVLGVLLGIVGTLVVPALADRAHHRVGAGGGDCDRRCGRDRRRVRRVPGPPRRAPRAHRRVAERVTWSRLHPHLPTASLGSSRRPSPGAHRAGGGTHAVAGARWWSRSSSWS